MNPRILFVHNDPAKFVQIDMALLQERGRVREWYQRSRIVNVPMLAQAVQRSNLLFGWFASWHTFFPILLARALQVPAILVVGGYDTADLPEIGYGSQRGGVKRWIAGTTMKMATRLVTNSCFTRDEAVRNVGVAPSKVRVVFHGLAAPESTSDRKKEALVVTVGNVDSSTLVRKGLEAFVRAAAHLDGIPIVLIGAWRDNAIERLKAIAPPNVRFMNRLSDLELDDCLSRAKVYVQASRHEGFGLSVAEAMLHKCVPVVTRTGALPEVVGDCGIYIDSPEPASIAEGVRRALEIDNGLGERARERVRREFPLSRRREQLNRLIDDVLKNG